MKSEKLDILNFSKVNFFKISLIYTAVILFIYAPLVMQSFVFFDDYNTLGKVLTKSGDVFSWDIYSGRPIYAFLRKIVHPYLTSIDNFAYLRMISILGTLCFCIFLHYFIITRVEFDNQLFSFFLPLFLSVAPAILVYNSWSVCFPYPFSIVLSGVAYLSAFDRDRNTTILRFCIGTFILICSFFIYQPIGMVFLFFVFLCNCIDSRKIKLSNLIYSAIMLVISMFVGLLAAKILPKILYGNTFSRSELVTDFLGKIHWFLKEPILNMLNNYKIIPNMFYEIISLLLFLLGLYFLYKSKNGFLKILLSLLFIIGIMASTLVIKENWASYRSCLGMEFIFITILVYAAAYFINKVISINTAQIVFVGVYTMLAIYTQDLIMQQFIQVSQVGYRALNQELMTKIPQDFTGKVRFDLSNIPWFALSKKARYDEFGNDSIHVAWCLQGMAVSIKNIKGFHYQTEGDMILQPNEVCKDNCVVIHVGNLLKRASIF